MKQTEEAEDQGEIVISIQSCLHNSSGGGQEAKARTYSSFAPEGRTKNNFPDFVSWPPIELFALSVQLMKPMNCVSLVPTARTIVAHGKSSQPWVRFQ